MASIVFCLVLALALQAADHLYHRKDLSQTSFASSNVSLKEFRKEFAGLGHRPLDNYFAILPFAWTYLLIIAAVIAFNTFDSVIVRGLLVLFVTGRFRSLQEIGHFAVHGALCPNLKWGMFLANVLYQFPALMPEARARKDIHVRRHHSSVNMEHDPDLKELLDVGLKPGISNARFWSALFFPLTWRGLLARVKEMISYLLADRFSLNFFLRIATIATVVGLFVAFDSVNALIFLYVVPVFITYPLFYWLAHVALHRWFAPCDPNLGYYERELELGRPTEFKGPIGFIVRHNIFPLGDSYHLAHSLFPNVRWNYLPQVDAIMKRYSPKYSENMSCNLIIPGRGLPSAVSELRERVVAGRMEELPQSL
ncbi:fatty acid desaturase family protein [Cystobacter fuscus]|uniref:fatty acid desaturase family protein n=1 Tax=Cystobacter fuscus TaxID=43 RepID=UPI0037BEFA5F